MLLLRLFFLCRGVSAGFLIDKSGPPVKADGIKGTVLFSLNSLRR
jgi:hypothetical protein